LKSPSGQLRDFDITLAFPGEGPRSDLQAAAPSPQPAAQMPGRFCCICGGHARVPFPSCSYCGDQPSYHRGRCCPRKPPPLRAPTGPLRDFDSTLGFPGEGPGLDRQAGAHSPRPVASMPGRFCSICGGYARVPFPSCSRCRCCSRAVAPSRSAGPNHRLDRPDRPPPRALRAAGRLGTTDRQSGVEPLGLSCSSAAVCRDWRSRTQRLLCCWAPSGTGSLPGRRRPQERRPPLVLSEVAPQGRRAAAYTQLEPLALCPLPSPPPPSASLPESR